MARRPHVLAVAYPAQGHVGPMMKFCNQLAEHGIRVTFVAPDFIHATVLAALPETGPVELVSIPSGVQPGDDLRNRTKVFDAMLQVMPGHFEDLIRKINLSDDDDNISCVISDFGWALESGKKLGIMAALFWPSLTPGLLLGIHIPELIEAGVVDNTGSVVRFFNIEEKSSWSERSACAIRSNSCLVNLRMFKLRFVGVLLKDEMIQLSSNKLAMSTSEFIWRFPGDAAKQELLFRYFFTTCRNASTCSWLLCNSFYELDPLAADSTPNLLSIGPLNLNSHTSNRNANFWPEDSTCIDWLNQQAARSVVYVSFGSLAHINQDQFEELALGLELIGHPFLWVVRADLIKGSSTECQDNLLGRVARQGKIVEWAPQIEVLSHPSIACFLTHCGWNSTMEGLSTGVSFLCWPRFGDQFLVKTYICNVWRVGLELKVVVGGLISRNEINTKLEELLRNADIRTNSMNQMEIAKKSVDKGGSSSRNFRSFTEQLWS